MVIASAGHILTHLRQPIHFGWSIIGSPASFISTQFTGQALWQRAPQAMHLPSRSDALPRGFLIGFFVSVINKPQVFVHFVQMRNR